MFWKTVEVAMEKFGKYMLVQKLAAGGMAEVFLAREFGISGFQRILAIKRVLPHLAVNEEFIEMFTEEARLSAQLSHQNIVQVYDFGIVDDSYFIAMEYIDGLTLNDMLDPGVLPDDVLDLDLALLIMCELCQGLGYAHDKRSLNNEPLNIVHRDISPKNIMLSYDGGVKLMDFGIAKAADSRRQETVVGTIKGKVAYLSPEQVVGQKLDRRSDLFSLGIVFYEMFTGHSCFTGDNEFSILYKIRTAEVRPIPTLNPRIDERLQAIIMKTLHPDREQRYQHADDLLADLNTYRYTKNAVAGPKQLANFLRRGRVEEEDDTLSLIQQIDWAEVEAAYGMLAPMEERSEDPTPVAADRRDPHHRTGTVETRPPHHEAKIEKKDSPPAFHDDPDPMKKIDPFDDLEDLASFEFERNEESIAPKVILAASLLLLVVVLAAVGLAGGLRFEKFFGLSFPPDPVVQGTPTPGRSLGSDGAPGAQADSDHFIATLPEIEPTPLRTKPPPRELKQASEPTVEPPPKTAVVPSPTRKPLPTPRPPRQRPTPVIPRVVSSIIDSVPAGATLLIDGKKVGKTPYRFRKAVVHRQYHLELSLAGYEKLSTKRKLSAGKLKLELQKIRDRRASVQFFSNIPVQLFMGSKNLGEVGSAGLKVKLPVGSHHLRAIGYQSSKKTFYRSDFKATALAGRTVVHNIEFPRVGTLRVTAYPDALVFVDGLEIEYTPLPRFKITAGRHEFRFQYPKGKNRRIRKDVRPGRLDFIHAQSP